MNATGVTSGAGTAYPSSTAGFNSVFSEGRVTRSLICYMCLGFVDRSLSFCLFFAIVLSVLLRFPDSDYPFGIFNFFLRFLPTHRDFVHLPKYVKWLPEYLQEYALKMS